MIVLMNNAEEKMLVDAYYEYEKKLEASDPFNPLPNVILSYEREGLYLSKSLYELLLDPIAAKKVLINNSFGLLGSLLYKYKDKLDIELLDFFIQKDIRRVGRRGSLGRLCASNLDFIPYKIRNDKNFFLRFIFVFPNCLFLASDELKKDKDFVLDVVSNGEYAYEYIHEDLKKDKNFICTLLSSNPYVFEYISDEFKNDKEIFKVMNFSDYKKTSMNNNFNIYEYIGEDILKNKELMLQFIKNNSLPNNDFYFDCIEYNIALFRRIGTWSEDALSVFKENEATVIGYFMLYTEFLTETNKKSIKNYFNVVAKIINYKIDINFFELESETKIVDEYLEYIIMFAKKKITISVTPEIYESIYNKYGTKYNKYIKCDEIEIYDEELPF